MHKKDHVQKWFGFLVHLFTASSAVIGLFALKEIMQRNYINAFWLMGATIFIDSVDGTFARKAEVKKHVPKISGDLLDNIVDYFTYVLVPAFFLLIHHDLLPTMLRGPIASMIVISSAYQFTQKDAKTKDHFFLGFPSYWNIVVFHLYIFEFPANVNAVILGLLCVLVFVPIKYIYLSQTDHLSHNKAFRCFIVFASLFYGLACFLLLWLYPKQNVILLTYIVIFLFFYLSLSIFRTIFPIKK